MLAATAWQATLEQGGTTLLVQWTGEVDCVASVSRLIDVANAFC